MVTILLSIPTQAIVGAMGIAIGLLFITATVRYFLQQQPSTISENEPLPPPLPPHIGPAPRGGVDASWVHPIDWLGALLFIFVFSYMGWASSSGEAVDSEKATVSGLVPHVSAFLTLIGCAVALVIWRISVIDWLGLRWKQWYHALWIGPVTVAIMWMLLIIYQTSGLMAWLEQLSGGSSMQDAVRLMREGKDDAVVIAMALIATVLAPLAEETIFRGYLYPFAKRYAGKTVALIFTALFFGAAHGNLPLLLPLTLLGGIMAYAYERTGSLWSSIAIHFCFNSATVLVQLAIRYEWITMPPST